MRRSEAAPALLCAGLIVVLGFDQGGYAPPSWVWSAALLAVVAGALLVGRPRRPGPLELAFLTALAGLVAWTLLSASWSLDPTASILEAQRLLLYLATAVALVLLSGPSSRGATLLGVLAGIAALCLAALGDVLIGDDAVGPETADPGSEDRLAGPVGYANALALLAAMGVLLAVGLSRLHRALLLLVPVFAATLYLTYSRGGWLALAFGLVVMVGMRLWTLDRRVAVGLGVAVIVAVAIAGTAAARSFDEATTTPGAGADRLRTLSGSSRPDYWRVAWRAVEEDPVLGAGAGSYGRYWLRERPVPQPARDAHSLVLETLAELGPVGLLLLGLALGLPVAAAVQARQDPLTPAGIGPLVAYVVHAAQDWDWELPAVTVPAIACAVVLLAGARDQRRVPLPQWVRVAGAVAATLLAALAVAAYAGNRELAEAENGSESSARRAARLQPWSAAPGRALGEAQLARGDVESARRSFRDALERDDGDAELLVDLALASEGAERQRALARAATLNPRDPAIAELRDEG